MLKIFEMFSGYGGASFALKKAGIPFECVGFSEIDKYAIQCYEQNHYTYKGPIELRSEHGEFLGIQNFGDCTKIDPNELPDFDLLTGGFPCQSFSAAGKGKGELDTRGTLFNEIIRIAEVKKPRYMLLENVKGLTFKNHKATFDKILSELDRIGYNVFWKVLNSKEHGIPQNRARVFFYCYRNDVFGGARFEFPQKEELKIFLKDILEDEVDEKYYLSEKQFKSLTSGIQKSKINPEIAASLQHPGHSGGNYRGMNIICIPVLTPDRLNKRQNGRRFKEDGDPSFTITAQDRHGVLISKNKNYYMSGKIYSNGDCGNGNRVFKPEGISQSIQSCTRTKILENYRIRRLTPTECFRLMGFLDDDIDLEGLSDSQRYKLAGNGWDINLVSKIFKNMFTTQSEEKNDGGKQ